MWCGNMKYGLSLLLIILLSATFSYASYHFYPEKQSSYQLYTQLYFNKFIFGFRAHTVISDSVYLNTRLVFFNLTKPALAAGFQFNDVGYDRKLFGFTGRKNRLFVDVYQ